MSKDPKNSDQPIEARTKRVKAQPSGDEGAASSTENTRALLLQAARTLFAAKGFDAATVKEIADHAGVNVSLVSYHFNGKEGLYRNCIEHFGKVRLEAAQRTLKPASSPEEFRLRLRMFIEAFFQLHLAEPHCGLILTRDVALETPLCEDIFKDTFLLVFTTLVSFVADGKTKGFVRADCEPHIASSIFFGSVLHFVRSDRTAKKFFNISLADDAHREKVERELVDVFCNGLFPIDVR